MDGKTKTSRINFKIDSGLKERLQVMALKTKESMTDILTEQIRNIVNNWETEND